MKCKRRLHVCNDKVIRVLEHNHVPDCAKVELCKAINKLKEKAFGLPDLRTRADGSISTSGSTLI